MIPTYLHGGKKIYMNFIFECTWQKQYLTKLFFSSWEMPGDRQRKNEFRRILKPTHGDAHGKRVSEDKSKREKPMPGDGKRV